MVPQITLTPTESQICRLLVEYTESHNAHAQPPLQLRITGGWVRDKLLGLESNDIDIAIDHTTGVEFAEGLQKYVAAKNNDGSVVGLHKIDKNPEKSKHLETCKTKIFGQEIDLVNLRNETYTEASRVPVVEYGTAEEDALRRDATINALFYNLHTSQVEDFTKRGLQDLKDGLIRTPLEPRKTFLDDPLRCLRLIRFAGRFDFDIVDDCVASMSTPEIHDVLVNKVSKERVGIEVGKMLRGPNVLKCLGLLYDTSLYRAIFTFGDLQDAIVDQNRDRKDEITHHLFVDQAATLESIVHRLPALETLMAGSPLDLSRRTKEQQYLQLLTLVLSHWSATPPYKLKGKPVSPIELVVKHGLKLPIKDASYARRTLDHAPSFIAFVHGPQSFSRADLAQQIMPLGADWPVFVQTCYILDCFGTPDDASAVLARYTDIHAHILALGLAEAHKLRPLLDGKTLSARLGRKPGPWMKAALDEMLVWQLNHPEGSVDDYFSSQKLH